jgi:TIR domain/Uncharacterized protein conserved in bacteria (DUF2188)
MEGLIHARQSVARFLLRRFRPVYESPTIHPRPDRFFHEAVSRPGRDSLAALQSSWCYHVSMPTMDALASELVRRAEFGDTRVGFWHKNGLGFLAAATDRDLEWDASEIVETGYLRIFAINETIRVRKIRFRIEAIDDKIRWSDQGGSASSHLTVELVLPPLYRKAKYFNTVAYSAHFDVLRAGVTRCRVAARRESEIFVMFNVGLRFDVALSFSSEDRAYAQSVAKALAARGIRTFYDDWEQASLWGGNLHQRLQQVYRNSRICLILLSKALLANRWALFETRAVTARAEGDPSVVVVPIRLDDSDPISLFSTVAWIDARRTSVDAIADLVASRVADDKTTRKPDTQELPGRIYHIISQGNEWILKAEGEPEPSAIYPAKDTAVAYGKELISDGSAREIVIHTLAGDVEQRLGADNVVSKQ